MECSPEHKSRSQADWKYLFQQCLILNRQVGFPGVGGQDASRWTWKGSDFPDNEVIQNRMRLAISGNCDVPISLSIIIIKIEINF